MRMVSTEDATGEEKTSGPAEWGFSVGNPADDGLGLGPT